MRLGATLFRSPTPKPQAQASHKGKGGAFRGRQNQQLQPGTDTPTQPDSHTGTGVSGADGGGGGGVKGGGSGIRARVPRNRVVGGRGWSRHRQGSLGSPGCRPHKRSHPALSDTWRLSVDGVLDNLGFGDTGEGSEEEENSGEDGGVLSTGQRTGRPAAALMADRGALATPRTKFGEVWVEPEEPELTPPTLPPCLEPPSCINNLNPSSAPELGRAGLVSFRPTTVGAAGSGFTTALDWNRAGSRGGSRSGGHNTGGGRPPHTPRHTQGGTRPSADLQPPITPAPLSHFLARYCTPDQAVADPPPALVPSLRVQAGGCTPTGLGLGRCRQGRGRGLQTGRGQCGALGRCRRWAPRTV